MNQPRQARAAAEIRGRGAGRIVLGREHIEPVVDEVGIELADDVGRVTCLVQAPLRLVQPDCGDGLRSKVAIHVPKVAAQMDQCTLNAQRRREIEGQQFWIESLIGYSVFALTDSQSAATTEPSAILLSGVVH